MGTINYIDIFKFILEGGVVIYFAKKYIEKIDKASEAIISIVPTLVAIKETVQSHSVHLEELFNSRNDQNAKHAEHSERLAEIDKMHEILRCAERWTGEERRKTPRIPK